MIKRLFDVVVSGFALLFFAPLLLLIGLAIKIDSPGPIFFRQERVGQFGRYFKIHKFRTMYVQDANQGLQITVAGDRRITKAGSFLRKNKLDELPQLIDVFLGQMSLVGPRPEVPFYIQYYPLEVVTIIQSVKPGITDWASIKFHQENELLVDSTNPHQTYLDEILPTKIRYYVDYVHNQSFLGDMGILFCTLAIMVRMRRT